MTLYSQIKQYLDYGLMVVVEGSEGYSVFHRILPDGEVEQTYHAEKIEEALINASALLDEKDVEEDREKNGWRIHSLLPRFITHYPEGMKVRVDEEYLVSQGTKTNAKEFRQEIKDAEIFTVNQINEEPTGGLNYRIFNSYGVPWSVDHRFLIPVLEEEPWKLGYTKEGWLKEGRKNGWIKEGEIIE